MTTLAPSPKYAVTALPVRRFSVAEYQRMINEGFFASDERFELVEGLIVEKMSRDPVHDAAIMLAEELLRTRLPDGWRVRVQSAIVTDESQPEPDLAVVRGQARDFAERHPVPGDVSLVVEVANFSLSYDRSTKQRLYARAGIGTYWIVNVVDRRVEVFEDPTGPTSEPSYRRRTEFGAGQDVPLSIGGAALDPLAVSELLP